MPSVYRNITPRAVADLVAGKADTPPNSFVRDTALPGFAIRVGRTKSSYVIEGRSGRGGRVCRYTLGTVGRLALDEARAQAKERIAELARGADPVVVLRAERGMAITASGALELLAQRRVKESTVADYRRSLAELGWLDRRLASITPQDVLAAYDARREHLTSAGRQFRSFRSVWNAAKGEHPALGECPTAALRNARRGWSATPRRQRTIADALLPAWRKQVAALKHEGVRDLLLFLHYTGARIGETRAMVVADVNLAAGWFTFPDPKMRVPVTIPLTKQTRAIIVRRLAATGGDGHLFPGYDVRKLHKAVDACEWSYHDLCRVFVGAARRLKVDSEIRRRLTNHRPSGDAHDGYFVTDADTLRPDAQRLADYFDGLARGRHARAATAGPTI